MKRIILSTLLLLTVACLFSCRKSDTEPDIKGYDNQQILGYISANGITGMQRDTSGGDTTGTYYKILTPGTGARVDYPDEISFVYTIRSFDGKYIATDTVLNHFDGFLGHVAPSGLVIAIHNILKYKGGKMRLLLPSHLAYGINGVGSGSKTLTNGRIAGNQCLDYTISLIDNQAAYDDMVIKTYMTANSLTGYTEITSGTGMGMYYKIITVGTGPQINDNSSVVCNYTGQLMNNTFFDQTYSPTIVAPATAISTATFSDLSQLTQGAHDGIKMCRGGSAISLLIPSALAYGTAGSSGIPANACLRFEFSNFVVTNY